MQNDKFVISLGDIGISADTFYYLLLRLLKNTADCFRSNGIVASAMAVKIGAELN